MDGKPCDKSDSRYRHGEKKEFSPVDFEKLEAVRAKKQQAAAVDPAAVAAEIPQPKVKAAPKKKAMAKTVDAEWDTAQDEGFDLSRLIDGGDPFKESED